VTHWRSARTRRTRACGYAMALSIGLGCASAEPAQSPVRVRALQDAASARTACEQRQWSSAARGFEHASLGFAAIEESLAEAGARRDEAEALRRAGLPAQAVTADERALQIDRHFDRTEDVARDLTGLARSAAAQGQTARAITTAEEAYNLAGAGTPLAAVIENDLALYLLARGDAADRARAQDLLNSALSANQARGETSSIATNELNLGRTALDSGDPDAAETSLQNALATFRELEDPVGLAHTHELLARLYFARHDDEQARFHLAQARAGFEFLKDAPSLARLDVLAQGTKP
jgi:tetratricopeptide (TPR) repeat protein